MRAASAVVGTVAMAAALVATAPHDRTPHDRLVATAPHDRTPHDRLVAAAPHDRTPHRIHQARLNATATEAYNHPYNHHKVVQHLKNTRHDAAHTRRHLPQRMTAWKRITETLTQAFLSYVGDDDDDDDDDDQSSSSDSESDTESTRKEPQQANANAKHSHFTAMASSALSHLGFTHLPKLWQKKKYRKKARAKKASAAKRTFDKTIVSNKVNENATKEENSIKEYGDGELAVEEGVPIVEQIFKMAGRSDVLSNPLRSLKEIERKVEASGRKLTFIEYVAMFEIMVLAVIAAGVFRSNLPAPIPLFTKT